MKIKGFNKYNLGLENALIAFYAHLLDKRHSESDISWLWSKSGRKTSADFDSEFRKVVLANTATPIVLRGYLFDVYVEGVKRREFQFKSLRERFLKEFYKSDAEAIKHERFRQLSSYIIHLELNVVRIKSYVKNASKLIMTDIDKDGYNIIGGYHLDFELITIQTKESQGHKPQLGQLKNKQEQAGQDDEGNNIPLTFKNNFDDVSPDQVYFFWKEKFVDGELLELEDLHSWLVAAFEKMKPLNERLSFKGSPKKKIVRNILCQYIDEISGHKHGKQRDNCSLIGEYFKSYDTDNLYKNLKKDY